MLQVERHIIASINQTRNQLASLQTDDKDTIVHAGAALEAAHEEIPETHGHARAGLIACLEALQALYQEEAADFDRLNKAVLGVLIATEQVLGALPNPITELMHQQACLTIRKELDLIGAEDSAVTATGDSLDTLDAVSQFLIMLDPDDRRGLETVCEALKTISVAEKDKDKRKSIVKAARELTKIATGKATNFDETLHLVSDLIDSANRADDEPLAPVVEAIAETALPKAEVSAADVIPDLSEEPVIAEAANVAQTVAATVMEDYEPDMMPGDADASLVSEFVVESFELLEAAESAFLTLETDPEDIENVNTVFRAFHTVKGSAAYLGFKRLTELAHHAESLLSRMRDREILCAGGYANLALRSLDTLKEMLGGVEKCSVGGTMKLPLTYAELLTILKNPEAHGVSGAADAVASASVKPTAAVAVETATEAISIEKIIEDAIPEALGEPSSLANQSFSSLEETVQKKTQSSDSSVRVRTDRLDRLIDMVGELVIAQSMLAQDATVVQGIHHELSRKISHAGKIVRELQDLSMGMRMIPLKNTFQKMARLVRDVAKKCGKKVEFVTEGEDTEIDRNMVDLIADPLIHMVRNAVDHGIERPEDRQSNGKSTTGRVKLSAYHAGGDVVVELTDDGAGLDPEKLVAKAIAKNLIESDKGMSENEIYRLIFAPGFSTAEAVTDVSGRGVGMDVVRRNIEAMRGRIEISSEKGKGSVFTIRLPLTLAITDGMLVRVGTERYIVPTVNIQLSFQPSRKMLSSVTGRGELVSLRGELMPVFRLHQLFDVSGALEEPTEGLLMIVADGRRRCALLVDELLGQQQVVTKTLGQGVGKIPGVSGGAILGDGCVGLILDTAEIVALARQSTGPVDRKEKEDPQKQQAA